jgi:endonuclease/exonuclease/phosphatase (EEP) superfamily protein YafD
MENAVSWLRKELNLTSAVSEFDRSTDTWKWTLKFGITLSRRFDHLLYPTNELYCPKAGVISVNYSDHRPIYGVFQNKKEE